MPGMDEVFMVGDSMNMYHMEVRPGQEFVWKRIFKSPSLSQLMSRALVYHHTYMHSLKEEEKAFEVGKGVRCVQYEL